MSYLHPVRLHFIGWFQADPSTVNNVAANYDIYTFSKQDVRTTPASWNPRGTGAWRLVDCVVKRVCYEDGTSTTDPRVDPVVGMRIADAGARVSAKIVDLDPDQQFVSEIWGLVVRLTDGTTDWFSGPFATAPFTNMWTRAQQCTQQQVQQGAMYQSVLQPVAWGDTRQSRFLTELQHAAHDDTLSIKFNIDGYDRTADAATFSYGRIAGTIGPASADEPQHFVLGRQLGGNVNNTGQYACAVLDRHSLRIDLGNAVQTTTPGGPPADNGEMLLGYLDPDGDFFAIDRVPYLEPDWYETTAGVQPYAVPPELRVVLASQRLAISIGGKVAMQENVDGLYVRADQFVYRLSPGDDPTVVDLYATQYGRLQADAKIVLSFCSTQQPLSALGGFTTGATVTARTGHFALSLTATNPGNPRCSIDGQVYVVRPVPEAVYKNAPDSWTNGSDTISVLVWNEFRAPRPTWHADIQPIFTQYGNLYPLMDELIDLGDYEAVAARASLLAFAFALPRSDPNSMPVTRDLSPAKRAAILTWLTTPGRDGKPLRGAWWWIFINAFLAWLCRLLTPAPPPKKLTRAQREKIGYDTEEE